MAGSSSPELRTDNVYLPDASTHNSPPSTLKTYGFIIAIIVGIGGLAVGGAGVAGYFHVGALSNLAQIDAIIMMAVGGGGGGGGVILLIVGIVGTVKNRKAVHVPESNPENRDILPPSIDISHPHHPDRIKKSQTKFIENASKGIIRDARRFGKAQWERDFGDVGDEPALRDDIDEILNSPCPFSGDDNTKVKDTHMLVLIPATVGGEALTLNKLEQLIQNPKEGHKTNYRGYEGSWTKDEHGSVKVGRSHWVLMTKDVLPGSRNKTYDEQKVLVQQYAGQDYVVPDAIEAAVCILMEFVASGEYLYSHHEPITRTRCAQTVQDRYPVIVGGFGFDGLRVSDDYFHGDTCGIAALRKF
jgi:hypothetical protein